MAVSYQKSCHLHSNGDKSLQSCLRHHGTHLCTDVWYPAEVRAFIWAPQGDQGSSRYAANKAAGQWEAWGWRVGHGAVPLPQVPRGTGWVRAGSGSTVRSKHSQKHSLVSDSGNTMSPASLMHGPVELTASSVSLRLFLRGCRLQPSPRAPVTSNHDLCNSSILVLPHSGSRSLCRSPQPENHPGPWPLPSGTCPQVHAGLQSCQAGTQATSPPVVTSALSRDHGQSPAQCLPPQPSALTHPPAPKWGVQRSAGQPWLPPASPRSSLRL